MPVPTRSRKAKQRHDEGGFAMLLVFLMASMIAITLYLEVPRIAMQTQRDKEQILIDRGEQYKRAIQLFVKKAGRYPGDIKELESFQNQRFLRHRYPDPMTGKDEWRLIHIQNGILTDSKISKPAGPGQQKDGGSTAGQFVGEQLAMGSTPNGPAGGATNARDRRRASEGGAATMPAGGLPGGDPNAQQNTGVPPLPGQPGSTYPGQVNSGQVIPGQVVPGQGNPGQVNQAGQVPGMTGIPGQLTPGTPMPGFNQPGIQPGFPGNRPGTANPTNTASSGGSFVGGSGSYVGGGGSYVGGGTTGSQMGAQGTTSYPGQPLPGQPGPPVNSQNFGGTPAYPTAPGSQGASPVFGQPGTTTGQNNAAADMIRNILTTPRPGGMPTGVAGAQTIGGGIAGVASQSEGEGVKVYNDHSLYAEWEFIFDPAKQKQIPNPNAQGAGGTPASQMGTPAGQQQPGQTTSPFGNPGSNGGFGTPARPVGRE
jgi:hypothetical protein